MRGLFDHAYPSDLAALVLQRWNEAFEAGRTDRQGGRGSRLGNAIATLGGKDPDYEPPGVPKSVPMNVSGRANNIESDIVVFLGGTTGQRRTRIGTVWESADTDAGLERAAAGELGCVHLRAARLQWTAFAWRLSEGWCERRDSNSNGIATASPSSWCVCQFRHFREVG